MCCERCVAVREKEKKVSHGGTAYTAGGEKRSQVCALWSLCRCERKREEVSHGGTANTAGREKRSQVCVP